MMLQLLIILNLILQNINSLTFGFRTKNGQKLIIGDISFRATSYHIGKVCEELSEVLAAYLRILQGLPVVIRPTKLIKRINNLDNSVRSLYELAPLGISRYILQKRDRFTHLKTYTTIFETPVIILFEREVPELLEIDLSGVITVDLIDEFVDNAPNFLVRLNSELNQINYNSANGLDEEEYSFKSSPNEFDEECDDDADEISI